MTRSPSGPRAEPDDGSALLRAARWLLRKGLPATDEEFLAGDLEESWRERAAGDRRAADRWLAWQTIRSIALRLPARLVPRRAGRDGRRRRDSAMSSMIRDCLLAVRRLTRSPGFTALVLLTMTLAIGFNSFVFSVVDGVLLQPLPVANADRLVRIWANTGGPDWHGGSEPEYLDLRRLEGLEEVAAMDSSRWIVDATGSAGTPPQVVRVHHWTTSFLRMTEARVLHGRLFDESDDRPDADLVALLTHGYWIRELGGDPGIVGGTLSLEGRPVRVIGVLAPDFWSPGSTVRIVTPLRIDEQDPWDRNNHYLSLFGLVEPGLRLEGLQGRLDRLASISNRDYPEFYDQLPLGYRAEPLAGAIVGEGRGPLWILMASVAIVLLIACLNVAGLFLIRARRRAGELAVRAALGAPAARLVRLQLFECALLALTGTAAGLVLAFALVRRLPELLPMALPRLENVQVDGRVLSFSAVVLVVTVCVAGLLPALAATRSSLRGRVETGATGRAGGRRGAQRMLVGVQILLAAGMLLLGGALLQHLAGLLEVDLGFEPEGVVALGVRLPRAQYDSGQAVVAFYREALSGIAALPGVESVGGANTLPLDDGTSNYSILLPGQENLTVGEAPTAHVVQALPGTFETLGITVLEGRSLETGDDERATPVVVVNRAMARQFWPGRSAVGERFKVFSEGYPWMEIVGVIDDVRHRELAEAPMPTWFVPHGQSYESAYYSSRALDLVVRADRPPAALAREVAAVVHRIDPGAPVSEPRPYERIVAGAVALPRFVSRLVLVFGLTALLLSCLGVYGVVALSVVERRREFAVRRAVGATARRIVRAVVGEGVLLLLAGAVGGLGLGLLALRSLRVVLPDLGAVGVGPVGFALGLLLLAGLAATLAPALRAGSADPATELRPE